MCFSAGLRHRNPFYRQPKKSILSKMEERDFERECAKMQQLEESSKKISKTSKKLVVAHHAQGKACGKLGQDLVADLGDDAPPSLESFKYAMNCQHILTVDKGKVLQQVLADPMKKYMTIFPSCTSHIKSRDKALQETNKVQAKLEKYEDKEHTASNSVKIEQIKKSLQPVKEDFQQKHSTLMAEMPTFYDARLSYIRPSLEAVVSVQCWFHKEAIRVLEECSQELGMGTKENAEKHVKTLMQEVNALSITSDD
ncbi:bridging integrator 3-like isoform X2 [Clavelina lepadiformis]|uniref:bridging integrator 3-like isoform X2 n=1 Tax=Clavelina lepadiformis TaxID=159417 RepID=UPI00404196C6